MELPQHWIVKSFHLQNPDESWSHQLGFVLVILVIAPEASSSSYFGDRFSAWLQNGVSTYRASSRSSLTWRAIYLDRDNTLGRNPKTTISGPRSYVLFWWLISRAQRIEALIWKSRHAPLLACLRTPRAGGFRNIEMLLELYDEIIKQQQWRTY